MVTSAASEVQGAWLSYPAQIRLPKVKRDFDQNRDPMIAAQLRDLETSEAERRREMSEGDQSGGGQSVSLSAQRDAALASHQRYRQTNAAPAPSNAPHHSPSHTPRYSGPSLG